MSYVIELQNISTHLVALSGMPGAPPLMLPGSRDGKGEHVALTSTQFEAIAYDIEGHSKGKYGVPRDLQLWARDTETGRCEPCSFEDARLAFQLNLGADDAAQQAQQAQIEQQRLEDAQRTAAATQAAQDAAGGGLVAGVSAAAAAGVI